jgi:hypothetical protein
VKIFTELVAALILENSMFPERNTSILEDEETEEDEVNHNEGKVQQQQLRKIKFGNGSHLFFFSD